MPCFKQQSCPFTYPRIFIIIVIIIIIVLSRAWFYLLLFRLPSCSSSWSTTVHNRPDTAFISSAENDRLKNISIRICFCLFAIYFCKSGSLQLLRVYWYNFAILHLIWSNCCNSSSTHYRMRASDLKIKIELIRLRANPCKRLKIITKLILIKKIPKYYTYRKQHLDFKLAAQISFLIMSWKLFCLQAKVHPKLAHICMRVAESYWMFKYWLINYTIHLQYTSLSLVCLCIGIWLKK